jgi:hypothetical protein
VEIRDARVEDVQAACQVMRRSIVELCTETARRFYLAAGYVEDGPPASLFGTQAGYPMKKRLGTLPSKPS